MAQTYAQIQNQIAKLQADAEKARREELGAVIAKVRQDIEIYGITSQDLFGGSGRKSGKAKGKASAKSDQAKYADGTGNVWVGRGPRPQWLRDALNAGKQLEEFLFGASPAAADSAPKAGAKKAASKKAPAKKAVAKKAAKKAPTESAAS
ncbi:hypothetical protein BH11PSE9_BH11PSE9_27460 [soil metagenome]